MNPRHKIAYFLSGLALLGICCQPTLPEPTTPKGAFKRLMLLQAQGDCEGVFALLVKEAREFVEKTYSNLKRCRQLIEAYPEPLRSEALAELGSPEVLEAQSPAKLYAVLVGLNRREPLTIADRLKSNIRRVTRTEHGTVVLTTASGEKSEWVLGGDGIYYYVPDSREAAIIKREFLKSIKLLDLYESRPKGSQERR